MEQKKTEAMVNSLQDAIAAAQGALDFANSSDPFKIAVCGSFSTGKTSLLNALLGCNLPTGMQPITKVVTRICYGPHFAMFFEDPNQKMRYKIDASKAEEFILNKTKNNENRYLRICCEIPAPFLKNRIEFLDTPGMQDDSTEKLDEVTKRAIQESDFCIVTFACDTFGDMTERKFLDELQELSDGNYVCVLNCLDRVRSEEQLNDLRAYADFILKDCGNEQIGMGRYFMVDSNEFSKEKYLDGLDNWLLSMVKTHATNIRRQAACSRGIAVLHPLIVDAEKLLSEMLKEQEYMVIASDKNRINQCRMASTSQGEIVKTLCRMKRDYFSKLDNEFCNDVRNQLKKLSDSEYNDKAAKCIDNLLGKYRDSFASMMQRNFKGYSLHNPESCFSITFQWTKRVVSSTKRSFSEYMALGLSTGYWSWDEYHVNDFLEGTISDTRTVTIPNLKKNIERYFSSIEKIFVGQFCVEILTEEDPKLVEIASQIQILSSVLLDAVRVQSNVMREKVR